MHVPLDWLPAGAVRPQVIPLLESDGSRYLMRTIETDLDLAGDVCCNVGALNVHRESLYYHLDRLTELTGLELNHIEQRLQVRRALKLLRLLG